GGGQAGGRPAGGAQGRPPGEPASAGRPASAGLAAESASAGFGGEADAEADQRRAGNGAHRALHASPAEDLLGGARGEGVARQPDKGDRDEDPGQGGSPRRCRPPPWPGSSSRSPLSG